MPEAEAAPTGYPRAFGKYILLRHLAIGGMADVFLAHQKGPAGFEKECVIKRILPNLAVDGEFIEMFLDEARIAARLSHPNIVQLFDLGQVGKDYFLAMEYVDGVNLEHVLERVAQHARANRAEPSLPWPLAVRIVAEAAAGLDHAHNARDGAGRSLGLVHRDISPSNIMLSWGGVAKILDFGIAKAVQGNIKRSKTEVGTVKGKVPYMSPEQLQGLPLDGRSDLFSLGVILYELTCGVRPFPAETAGPLTMQILHEDPRPPAPGGEAYPPGLWAIVKRALAKQPAARYQSARDFKVALEQFLAAQHSSCTAYDVEAYLRELFPAEAQRQVVSGPPPALLVSGLEATEGRLPASGPVPAAVDPARIGAAPSPAPPEPAAAKERERAMDVDDKRSGPPASRVPTGARQGPSGRLEVPAGLDDLLAEEGRPRRRHGGGLVMLAIAALVVVTAVVLFALRRHVLKDDGKAPPSAVAADPAKAGPAAEPPKPAEPVKQPEEPKRAEPVKKPEEPVKKPEEPKKAEPKKAEARAPEPKRPAAAHPRPDKRPDKKPDKEDDGPVRLPRLPTPPPPEPEQ